MKLKPLGRAFALLALVGGFGAVATQVLAEDQLAAPPAEQPAAVTATARKAETGELAVDMNAWRETGFIPGPVSVSRPRR